MVIFFLWFFLSSPFNSLPQQDLYLEAYLDSDDPWYPGQENSVVYKIWYKGEIALTQEELPLLDIEGLEKVGDKVFYEQQIPPFSIQEINQKYVAKHPASYTVGPSTLEGVHYVMESGNKKLLPPKIISKTPPYTITIVPFPELGKPLDFNGSIGTGTLTFTPPKEREARVGEWIFFSITATGFEPSSVLEPPNLNCLPGFAGFFRYDAASTVKKVNQADQSTTFQFKIVPENALSQEIPEITWSLFNPKTKSYKTFSFPKTPIQLVDSLPANPIHPIDIRSLQHQQKLSPLSLPPSSPKTTLIRSFNLAWPTLSLILLGILFAYLLLRKPVRKLYLLYLFNPLRQAEKEIKNQSDPVAVAKTMRSLLKSALKRKKIDNQEVSNFIQLLEQFSYFKGVSLTKETILKRGRQLYKSLPILLIALPCSLFGQIEIHMQKGNSANTWIERENEWNAALIDLLAAPPSKQNNIAIAFLLDQLNSKAEALFYLHRALLEDPADKDVKNKIKIMSDQLGVQEVQPLMPHLPETHFNLLCFLLILLGFFFLYQRKRKWAYPVFILSYLLIALSYIVPLFTPKSALVLKPSFLYLQSDLKEKSTPVPLVPGDFVEIVGADQETFKIYSYPLKAYGYVFQNNIRPID